MGYFSTKKIWVGAATAVNIIDAQDGANATLLADAITRAILKGQDVVQSILHLYNNIPSGMDIPLYIKNSQQHFPMDIHHVRQYMGLVSDGSKLEYIDESSNSTALLRPLPVVPLKVNGTDIGGDAREEAVESLEALGLDINEIVAQVMANPKSDKINDITLGSTVSLVGTSQIEQGYLYHFFREISKKITMSTWSFWGVSNGFHYYTFRAGEYRRNLVLNNVKQGTYTGVGRVGTYGSREIEFLGTYRWCCPMIGCSNLVVGMPSSDSSSYCTSTIVEYPSWHLEWWYQETPTVRRYIRCAPILEALIPPAGNHPFLSAREVYKDFLNDGEEYISWFIGADDRVTHIYEAELLEAFRLPVCQTVLDHMHLDDLEMDSLMQHSMSLDITSLDYYELKWYHTFLFQTILSIASIVLSAFTGPGALFLNFVLTGMASMMAEMLGTMGGLIFGIILVIMGSAQGITAGVEAMTKVTAIGLIQGVSSVLSLTSEIAFSVTTYLQAEDMKDILEDAAEHADKKAAWQDDFDRISELLEDDVTAFNYIGQPYFPNETIGQTMDRTIHTPNPGTMIFDLIEDFVPISLALPSYEGKFGPA